MSSLDAFAAEKLRDLDARTLRRILVETERGAASRAVRRDGDGNRRALISFCCNDYLNLSQHPAVKQAMAEAALEYGAGAGASRLVTGTSALVTALEKRLARLKGTEDAVVFGSGYLTNLGVIPSLVGRQDLILVDELAHACLYGGAQLAGARVAVFRHNDVAHAASLLQALRPDHPRALLLTDGVFSMDGDLAPLEALTRLARTYDVWLMSDDAHGLGVLGGGAGSAAALALDGGDIDVPLQMGTLSKAVGVYGGYLCASRAVVDFIKTRARSFIYSTALPPPCVAACLAALDIIESDAALRARPLDNARLFASLAGLNAAPQSTIIPVVLGDPKRALAASRLLEENGFLVSAIRPPSVPEGTARLRLTFTAAHRPDDIRRLAKIIRGEIINEGVQ